jgi:hypothetical protein
VLLGESGGALPAGNIEGKELPEAAFVLAKDPATFRVAPAFASSIKDFTYCPMENKFGKESCIPHCNVSDC